MSDTPQCDLMSGGDYGKAEWKRLAFSLEGDGSVLRRLLAAANERSALLEGTLRRIVFADSRDTLQAAFDAGREVIEEIKHNTDNKEEAKMNRIPPSFDAPCPHVPSVTAPVHCADCVRDYLAAANEQHDIAATKLGEREIENARLRAENEEQARLLGMSGSREAALRADVERLTRER